jgi:DNA polymerase-3 subunit beta
MDALKAAGKDELSICLNTASSPCIIRAADGSDNFTYMILPVRLRAGE